MFFEVLETLSLPGDPFKPNDDAFGHEHNAAVVLDGATSLGAPLMPGESDAAWIAHFGARRLMAHVRDGETPKDALRGTLADAQKSFHGLRRREPEAKWEIPVASMAFAFANPDGFDFLWFGDCAGLLYRPNATVEVLGQAFAAKAREAKSAATLAKQIKISPVASGIASPFLPALREARSRLNSGNNWVFGPDPSAAEHVSMLHVQAPKDALLLLASDGFLALTTDYAAYTPNSLMNKAIERGIASLGEELREIEEADPHGKKHARFKKSDDATAVLLKIL